jgi:hypothetical protein
MIRKRSLAITAAGVVVAAGTAIGIFGPVTGTAHAQGTSSISIVGMAENPEDNGSTVEISFTCTATGTATTGAPSYEAVDVTAIQGGTATGSVGYTICTGSPQTVTINLGDPSGSVQQFGTGPVQVSASGIYDYRAAYPYVYSFTGTAATVSYTAATTTNP